MTMNKNIKVLCYTDNTDNTKGTLLAVDAEKELHTEEMTEKINKVIEDSGILDMYEDPINVMEVGRQIAFLGQSEYGDYAFYFEEVPYLC